jgi:hypothetical protein
MPERQQITNDSDDDMAELNSIFVRSHCHATARPVEGQEALGFRGAGCFQAVQRKPSGLHYDILLDPRYFAGRPK